MNVSSTIGSVRTFFAKLWRWFKAQKRWIQILIIVVLLIVVGGIIVLARGKAASTTGTVAPTVTLEAIGDFGGSSNGVSALGTVRSISEADILAQAGGTVEAVHTSIGKNVGAGFIIAELDNASQRASVLQAQGGYDAAVAARNITLLQSGNSTQSLSDEETVIRNTYQSTYNTLDTVLTTEVDTFFGSPGVYGPSLLIKPGPTNFGDLSRRRTAISDQMDAYKLDLANAHTENADTLLTKDRILLQTISAFLSDLATAASATNSGVTPAQQAALAAARTTVDGLLSAVSAARDAYNAKKTAAAVGSAQSQSSTNVTASADASVEQALGGLRAAQALLEKTYIRAPIAGTVNFLPIHVGDNVSLNQHVATVARNNALEVVMYLSQTDSNRLAVGDSITIQGTYKGVVTIIAPALDPTTKQIEVDIAVNDGSNLVNGQSVQITLPALITSAVKGHETAATTTVSTVTTTLLPLTAVKLLPNERDVFTVDASSHLVAHTVEIGTVVGSYIQILTPLDPSMKIITDARGLSAGDAVVVSDAPPAGGA